jgi:hypothetical protein
MNHNTASGKQLPTPPKKLGGAIKDNTYQSEPYWPPTTWDKRYTICPLCAQRVQYARRAAHGCFKSHLSEIARNVQQMNRE